MARVVLVTGCSSGVGLHTAVQLAAKGYKVYASMRQLHKRAALDAAAASGGINLVVLHLDVEKPATIKAAVKQIISNEGRLDVLVQALDELSTEDLREAREGGFLGALQCLTTVLPHMRAARSGHVVSLRSEADVEGQPFENLAAFMEPLFGVKMTLLAPTVGLEQTAAAAEVAEIIVGLIETPAHLNLAQLQGMKKTPSTERPQRGFFQ